MEDEEPTDTKVARSKKVAIDPLSTAKKFTDSYTNPLGGANHHKRFSEDNNYIQAPSDDRFAN